MSRPATARLKVNPPTGSLPVLQYCSPEQLQIDEGYQRSLATSQSQTLIRKIAMFWDWGLCQPLVVARRADGALYVVDGQHRLAGAKLRGDIWQLPCVIASYSSAAEEAAAFVAINQERRALGALDIFRAAFAAGDETASAVMKALDDAGLTLATTTNNVDTPAGAVANVGGMQSCYRMHGPIVLVSALAVLGESFSGQVLRYAGSMFQGLAEVVSSEVKAFGANWRLGDRFALMTEMVGGCEQADWYKDILTAVANDPNLNRRAASKQVFELAWAECLAEALDEAA